MQIRQFIRDIPYWAFRMRRRFATAAVGLAAFLLLAHVVFGANGLAVYVKKREENKKLQKEIQVLQEDNQKLEQNIDALKHDPKAIEKEARTQLKYARPGEVIYILPEVKKNKPATQTAQSKAPQDAKAPETNAPVTKK